MKNTELNFKKFVPYVVDFDYIDEKVDFYVTSPDTSEVKMGFSFIIQFFSDKTITEPIYASFQKSFFMSCDGSKYEIRCDNLIARRVLSEVLNLQNEKKPIHCIWYFYDLNSCNEQPQFMHHFFLVNDDKIVSDKVVISTSWMDKCDVNVLIEDEPFLLEDSSLPLWDNEEGDMKAATFWYYQKFYEETNRGQILAIKENIGGATIATSTCLSIKTMPSLHSSFGQVRLLSSINKKLIWLVGMIAVLLIKILF